MEGGGGGQDICFDAHLCLLGVWGHVPSGNFGFFGNQGWHLMPVSVTK